MPESNPWNLVTPALAPIYPPQDVAHVDLHVCNGGHAANPVDVPLGLCLAEEGCLARPMSRRRRHLLTRDTNFCCHCARDCCPVASRQAQDKGKEGKVKDVGLGYMVKSFWPRNCVNPPDIRVMYTESFSQSQPKKEETDQMLWQGEGILHFTYICAMPGFMSASFDMRSATSSGVYRRTNQND